MTEARTGGVRRDLAFTVVVALVAVLPRLFVAIAWGEPVWDGHYYHEGAIRIASGLGYSEDVIVDGARVWKPWCHYPVGYSAMLAGLYSAFGDGLLVAPVANALLGTALVLVVHRLARRYTTENRARVAAGLAALHPGLIAYCALFMNEVLTSLLILVAVYVAIRWRGQWHGIVPAGIILGLATLVRPSALLTAPLLALATPPPRWKGVLWGVMATALSLMVVTPWTMRNCRVMDGCAFVSTNGGWNLAIGALSPTGRYHKLTAGDGCRVVTGQVQQDRCWARVGARTIASDPWHWLSLVPKKLGHTFDHESFAIEYLHEASPATWPEGRRVAGRQLLTGFHRLLVVAAALGLFTLLPVERRWTRGGIAQLAGTTVVVLFGMYALGAITHPFYPLVAAMPVVALLRLPGAPRHGPVGRTLLAWLAATTLVHAVFFGEDRYHIVVTPILCVLAACALRRPGETPAVVR